MRLDRENNAYYTLVDALLLRPERPMPKPMPDPANPQFNIIYQPPPGSMGRLIGITRPDGHPEFLQYLRDSEPAIELAHTVLKKEYLLYEYPWFNLSLLNRFPAPASIDSMLSTWLAHASAQAQFWDEKEQSLQSFDTLFYAYQLEKQQVQHFYVADFRWDNYYQTIMNVVRNADDPAFVNDIEQMLRNQPLPFDDMVAVLHLALQVLDDSLNSPNIFAKRDLTLDLDIGDQLYLMAVQNIADFYSEQLLTLEEIAPKPIPELAKWAQSTEWADLPWTDYMDALFTMGMMHMLETAHQANALQQVALLSIDLERYKSNTGAYPAELNDLVPDYMNEVPISRATLAPFGYTKTESAYIIEDQSIRSFDFVGDVGRKRRVYYVVEKNFLSSSGILQIHELEETNDH